MKKELTKEDVKTLRLEVETLIFEVDHTHRYSMSRIYGLYNKVFEKNETPQSCASCLIRKVRELRNWLEMQKVDDVSIINSKVKKSRKKAKNDEV